jgi:hypothetical protein
MPYAWTDPEQFLQHAGVTVYHCYDDDGMVSTIWYTTVAANNNVDGGDEDGQFCVEDIPSPFHSDDHVQIINYAIDQGWLTEAGLYLPQELAP